MEYKNVMNNTNNENLKNKALVRAEKIGEIEVNMVKPHGKPH